MIEVSQKRRPTSVFLLNKPVLFWVYCCLQIDLILGDAKCLRLCNLFPINPTFATIENTSALWLEKKLNLTFFFLNQWKIISLFFKNIILVLYFSTLSAKQFYLWFLYLTCNFTSLYVFLLSKHIHFSKFCYNTVYPLL